MTRQSGDHPKLTDKIADAIVSDIREQGLMPGDSLPPEAEMCERFNVSRTVVREALTYLSAAGIVETGNGRRPRIASLNANVVARLFSHGLHVREITTAQIMEARRGVEIETVRLAAFRRTDENLVALRDILAKMTAANEDPEEFIELDFAFHHEIAHATQNRVFIHLIDALRIPIQRTIRTAFRQIGVQAQWLTKVTEDHKMIMKFIEEQKVEAAVMAMTTHLDQSFSSQNYWVVN